MYSYQFPYLYQIGHLKLLDYYFYRFQAKDCLRYFVIIEFYKTCTVLILATHHKTYVIHHQSQSGPKKKKAVSI